MAIQQFHVRVEHVRDLTYDVRELVLRLLDPPKIDFKAGQFVSFEVPHPTLHRPVTRPYSIVSPPSRPDVITLLFNLVPGGPGSTYLFSLRPGDETRFKGPAGAFYVRDDPARDLLFVATGTGIAPIRSMIEDRLERGFARRITLYWGLRSERDVYYREELGALAERHPHFSYIITLSRPQGRWTGEIGRVTKLVEERLTSVKNLAVYLCGNSGMIRDVTALVNRKGLCPIYREKYYDDSGECPDD
jgi:NAD(P)H-flavin reductase